LYIGLEVTSDAMAKLADAGFDPVFGAIPLKRAIQNRLEKPLALKLLDEKFKADDKIIVNLANIKIMLLGSGELGKEFVIAAQRLGIYTIAVNRYKDAPAVQVAHQSFTIDMHNAEELE
jgi:hypothetical protein